MKVLKNVKLDESIIGGGRIVETEEKLPDRVLCRVVYPICNIGKANANHRIYGRDVWERLFENKALMDSIKDRALFGHAEHPEGTQSKTPLISHVMVRMWMDESKVYNEMDVLDTPQGRIIDALLAANCNIGVSTRAEGDLREDVDGDGNKCYHVIAEAYNFKVTDFTAEPSTFGAFPMDVKRDILSVIRKEIDNERIKPEEKRFAMKLFESIKCDESGNCKIVESDDHEEKSGVNCDVCGEFVAEKDIRVDKFDNVLCPTCEKMINLLMAHDMDWSNLDKSTGEKLHDVIKKNDMKTAQTIVAEIKPYKAGGHKKTNEDQVTIAAGGDGNVAVTGDVQKIVVDPQVNTDAPGGPIDVTVLPKGDQTAVVNITKPEEVPEPVKDIEDVPEDGTQPETGEIDGDISDDDIELSDEDFKEEFDLDIEDVEESKISETEDIKKLYTSKGLKPPKGKGVHTKAFHKCAANYAAKIKSGKMTKQEAYERCMGGLGKKHAVKKAHQKNESREQVVDYINEMLNERYKVGNTVQIKDKEGNTTIVPSGRVVEVDTTEPEGTTAIRIGGIDDWYDESQYEITILEESKICEDKGIIFVDETGFLNDKFGVYRKTTDSEAYLTFSFPTREKAVEMAKIIAGMLETAYSETIPGKATTDESKSKAWDVVLRGKVIDTVFWDDDIAADEVKKSLINHDGYDSNIEVKLQEKKIPSMLAKDITELQIKEAVVRSERDVAVGSLGVLANKDLEVRILTKKLKETKDMECDVPALRTKLEEKARSAQDLMKRVNLLTAKALKTDALVEDLKKKRDEEIAQLDRERDEALAKVEKEFREKIKQAQRKVRESIIKEYSTKVLGELKISDSQRALLESCQTIVAVDKALDECRDVSRRRALHADPITEVIVEKRVEPIDPVKDRQKTIINSVLGSKS